MKTDDDEITSEQDLDLSLTGRTLRVYWFLLKVKEPVNRKDVQRGVKLSSASLAEYHLKKLIELGLVEKQLHGDYVVTKIVRVGVTRFYDIFFLVICVILFGLVTSIFELIILLKSTRF